MPLAVPGIAAAVAAILAILILWATGTFAKAIAGLIPSDIPVFAQLHRLILAIGVAAISALQWIMADVIAPAFSFISKPVFAIVQFLESVRALARTMSTSWLWLLNSAIPGIISLLKRYALNLYHLVRAYAQTLYAKAEAYALSLYAKVHAYALALYTTVHAYALNLYGLARTYALSLYRAEQAARVAAVAAASAGAAELVRVARVDLGRAITAVEKEIKTAAGASTAYVEAAIATAETAVIATSAAQVAQGLHDLTTDVDAAAAAVFDGLIIDVGELADVIGTDLPDIGALVRSIPRAVPTDIAGTIGLSLALERVAVRYMTKCGVPNCRNLSKIGRDLSTLFDVLEGGAFLGMLAYLVADPQGAAQEARDVLGPVADGVAVAARDLIGV